MNRRHEDFQPTPPSLNLTPFNALGVRIFAARNFAQNYWGIPPGKIAPNLAPQRDYRPKIPCTKIGNPNAMTIASVANNSPMAIAPQA